MPKKGVDGVKSDAKPDQTKKSSFSRLFRVNIEKKSESEPKSEPKKPLFSGFFKTKKEEVKDEYRRKEEKELRRLQAEVRALEKRHGLSPEILKGIPPTWFYIGSIFAAFLFAIYLSVYTTLNFEDIQFMNVTVIFLFISMVSFFLVAALYFLTEKMIKHSIAPILFFTGVVAIMFYAFKAVDTTNLVRFSIFYAIIVTGVSMYILLVRK